MGDKEQQVVELKESMAMIYLPTNCVFARIECTVVSDAGDVSKVCKELTVSDVWDAFRDAEENYIDPDEKFVVTEEGLNWLNGLDRKSDE